MCTQSKSFFYPRSPELAHAVLGGMLVSLHIVGVDEGACPGPGAVEEVRRSMKTPDGSGVPRGIGVQGTEDVVVAPAARDADQIVARHCVLEAVGDRIANSDASRLTRGFQRASTGDASTVCTAGSGTRRLPAPRVGAVGRCIPRRRRVRTRVPGGTRSPCTRDIPRRRIFAPEGS